ncbi:hypothetical protein B0H17DRAFT_1198971 [Mycena rosella]|uniref:FHA domain-containing protein n=1 Tax=Mycena rosella TaxID=1033263 RepID=A0AAD7DP35_MYCRO|nr:hypothetical protein B0H17DRAFT_1198971 [Mycena rosella]
MSAPNPNPYPPQTNASPALHLYPLDDSFIPKRIALGGGQRVKIARPPNTKTQPGERNGYFDSRVLSRQHAEVWEEGNKIFIKDVKSSNGTFINGERLSLEGRESEPYELKSDDILEFGVDIVSEDNKTVLHRKVVARVNCVFPPKSASALHHHQLQQQQQHQSLPADQFATLSQTGATFNGLAAQRRPQMPMIHQGLAGLGGMGGGQRAPGRGLTLDHIFSRLQAELAKSRDTGNDLQVLTGALSGIEETLNGAGPPTAGPPSFPDVLPAVRPRPVSVPTLPVLPVVETKADASADAVAELQAQLREHQAALAAHVEGIRALEGVLAEQEAMKREVRELREFVGVDRAREGLQPEEEDEELEGEELEELEGELEGEGSDDESDAQSVMTVTPHELDRVEEEDEGEEGLEDARGQGEQSEEPPSQAQQDADALQEREDNFTRQRAQTPEPTMDMEDTSPPRSPPPPQSQTETEPAPEPAPEPETQTQLTKEEAGAEPAALSLGELTARLAQLSLHLESALAASSALQAQHASAQATIAVLEAKLARLEERGTSDTPPAPAAVAPSVDLEDLQAQLAAMHAELVAERGQREAWAGAVEARMRVVAGANGHVNGVEGKLLHALHEPATWSIGSSGSTSPSPSLSRSLSPEEKPQLELELEEHEEGKPSLALALSPALPVSESQKSDAAMIHLNVQTALGVLILGIAAAAVLWRVKPE